jgi:tripeptidyl-peptidase-1
MLLNFPSITSVGGTISIPEVAVDFSGGGFSNYVSHVFAVQTCCVDVVLKFARPQYQDEVVSRYLDGIPEGVYEGLFNRSGRVSSLSAFLSYVHH